MDAAPRLVDVNDKGSTRREPAPLTSNLLARKGEAVSAAREVLNAHQAGAMPHAVAAVETPRNPEARPRTGVVFSKRWVAVAAVLLVGGSVAVGYLSRPAIDNRSVVKSEAVAKTEPTAEKTAPAPIPIVPKRDLIATDIAVASGPKALVSAAPAATDEAKPTRIVVKTVPTAPTQPKLLLPPKPPAATPVAAIAAIEQNAVPAVAPAAPVKIAVPAPVAVLPPPVPEAAVKSVAKPVAKPVPGPRSTEIAARTPPPAVSAPIVIQPYVVQLASLKSKPAALREWSRLKKRYTSLFSALEPSVQKASIAKRGTFYRLRADGFATRRQANKACQKIKAAGQGCLVVKR